MDRSVTTVDLRPRPSYGALRILLPLHAVPLACIPLFFHGAAWLPLLLAACVGGSWLYVRRHPALGFGPRALTRLVAHDDGRWTVEDSAGHTRRAELRGGSVVLTRLLLLNFRLEDGCRRSRLLLGDEAGAEPLRRLRARLLNTRANSARAT